MCLEDQPQQNNQGLLKMTVSYVPPCCSVTKLCPTICHPMDCSMPGFPVLPCLPELAQLMPIESVMPYNHLILCHPLLLLPLIFPTSGPFPVSRLFASDGQSIGASASASVLPMNIYLNLVISLFLKEGTWNLHLFFQFYSDVIRRLHAVSSKCSVVLWHIYHEMIITIILMNVCHLI